MIRLFAILLALAVAVPAHAQTELRVGWCAKTISPAASPFAIATKFGWFAERGIKVTVVQIGRAHV